MENAMQFIRVLPETTSEIKLFADKVLAETQIREALPLLARLSAMEKLAKMIKDGLKEQLMEEASLYGGEKTFEINGVRYTKTERRNFHYQHCSKWRELNEQIEAIEKHMQIGDWVDPDTGEVVPKATVSYSESITVTLKKD
jgi:hypothetical protein